MKKVNRINEKRKSNEGYEMIIISYENATNITVEFQDKHKARVRTNYNRFIEGGVKNPYHPSVYNVGYLGQGKYKTRKDKKNVEAYIIWTNMMERCYNPYYLNKHFTYIDCYVCEEWHNFQNFAEWYYNNIYECRNEMLCLDKDILIKGNKIYSPETCVFVPQRINKLFIKTDINRGEYPIGVCYDKKGSFLKVRCSILDDDKKIIKHLGTFPLNKPFQAFTCYKNFKENYIKQVADEYKELIPKKLYEALYKYEVEIND